MAATRDAGRRCPLQRRLGPREDRLCFSLSSSLTACASAGKTEGEAVV
ncbi:hypothetical protein SVAN01_11951 [Stagonosporopsis vannaccii]|nr:hypothetical protein SVAN01_11951 [Stagonosporopsis vannaccii]